MNIAPAETSEAYHALDGHVSASMLKVLAESPLKYFHRYVSGDLDGVETDAMVFGRAFHAAILEPDLFQETYVVAPKFDRRTTVGKQGWAEWQAANRDKQSLDADTFGTLLTMQAACRKHATLAKLLDMYGSVEQSIRWFDRIDRKAKPDKVLPDVGVILDLKSVAHPAPHGFAGAAARFGYWIQAPWYLDAVREKFPDVENWRFLFAAVGKERPHEVGVYELTFDDLEWAEQKCERLVTELIGRTASGEWRAAWQQEITECPLPKWLRSDFYSVEDPFSIESEE